MTSELHASTPRVFVEHPLSASVEFPATAPQAHYLRQVMRRGAGDAVLVFNGRDGEWRADLVPQGSKAAALRPIAQTRAQEPLPPVTLAFAPVKGPRLDFMIEKATELGVGVLAPIITARTIVTTTKDARLTATAVEAAEQCGRTTVPEIKAAMAWRDFIASLSAASDARVYFLDEAGARANAAQPISAVRGAAPAILVVGPEGGFTPDEARALRAVPRATAVSLGPRILRAETAALAALSIWQALAGDWPR